MSSDSFDLSQVHFTRRADIVDPGKTIYNPEHSTVRTRKGDDQIIGTSSVSYDLGVSIRVTAEEVGLGTNPVGSGEVTTQAQLYVNGIINEGDIFTNRGRDIVSGSANAQFTAAASAASEAIAIASNANATAIASSLAAIEITGIANGINNSGRIFTGPGSDTISGEVKAGVAAVAQASIDVTSIVTAIAQAPTSDGLKAVAAGFAQSIAKAKVVATGLNNNHGELRTGGGADKISAAATSYSATYSEAEISGFTTANPGNKALILGVIEAVAQTEEIAIAIYNQNGHMRTGYGDDTIEATANASDKTVGIYNKYGNINTGYGKDTIQIDITGSESYGIYSGNVNAGYGADTLNVSASGDKSYGIYGSNVNTGYGNDTIQVDVTGSESYGIYAGKINTGYGDDVLKTSTFGGGVNIQMGYGIDYVQGFGHARVDGGEHFDTLSLGSYSKSDFNIYTSNGLTVFEMDGITMETTGFEKYTFADGDYSFDNLIA
ncbi:MAG: hypothetical protein AAFS12_04550 [Cyanobacteria bacterium J06632_19]